MKFHLVASGSKGNCFILQEGKRTIVIDCGSTKKHLKESFEKLNIPINSIDLLLITHTHSDHISQLSLFDDVLVYSPVELEKRKDAKIIRPGCYFSIDKMKVSCIPLSHDAEKTVGYVFETEKEKLVYVTDTGYINTSYIPKFYDADYVIMESNHDVKMLMESSRPQYIKQRIYSDYGHMSNEDCAATLEAIITNKTKEIVLAHISAQANTYEQALNVTVNHLLETKKDELNENLRIVAAQQFEIISGGLDYEKVDDCSSLFASDLEWIFNN